MFSGNKHCCFVPFLNFSGQVYCLGRAEYGRLGLGEGAEEKSEPTLVTGIEPAQAVTCGASVSYAVTKEGKKHSMCNTGSRETSNLENSKTTPSLVFTEGHPLFTHMLKISSLQSQLHCLQSAGVPFTLCSSLRLMLFMRKMKREITFQLCY